MSKIIKLFRFAAEEIVGEVTDETSDTYQVKNPVSLRFMPVSKTDPSQRQLALIPVLDHCKDSTIEIHRSSLMWSPCEPRDEIQTHYTSLFSGLVLPTGANVKGFANAKQISS